MSQKIIIVGNSISAEITFELIKNDSRYEVLCFISDSEFIKENTFCGLNVVDTTKLKDLYNPKEVKLVMAVGYRGLNKIRAELFNKLKEQGFTFETYIHQDAKVYNSDKIGEGSFIMPNAVIEPFTKIGKNSVIWSNTTIGHHSEVGDNCWIAASSVLAGNVSIKDFSFLGVGVVVSYSVVIEKSNIIGAGANITRCTKENEVFLSRSGEKHRFDSENYAKFYLK